MIKYWTPQEDNILHEYYTHGLETLKEKLPHRSESAIRARLHKSNLYLQPLNYVIERIYTVD